MALDLNALRQQAKNKKPVITKPKTVSKVVKENKPVQKKPSGGIKLAIGPRKKLEPKADAVAATTILPKEVESEAPNVKPDTVEKATPDPIPSPLSGESKASDPALDVDESLMSQQERFIHNINRLDTVIHDKDLLGSVLADLMLELSENPDYKDFMSDEHLNTMMRGMMETFGVVKASKAKKTSASKKAAGTRKKKKKPLSENARNMLETMELKDGKLDIDSLAGIVL